MLSIRKALFPPINEKVLIAVYFTQTRGERISLFNYLQVGNCDEIRKMHRFEVIKRVHDASPFLCRWMQDYMRTMVVGMSNLFVRIVGFFVAFLLCMRPLR